jgi:3-oxoacid CoA-transferase subunit A/glutaconate CoA-transferase subunit A
VILTAEEIVEEDQIRAEPCRTVIPFYVVDAVCHVPFGAHPTQMPYLYFFDEEHIGEWLQVSRTLEGAEAYFERYVHGVRDFDEYLQEVGGDEKMRFLRRVERFEAPMRAPWLKVKGG